MEKSKKSDFVQGAITLLLVGIMIGLAELTGEKEIIFPEITALAVGSFLAPKKSWQVSSARMLGLIALCAFIGFGISCYVSLPLSLKVILAFVICQIIYLYSGTNFAPMISAMVLPVLMGTESSVYLVTAICLTGLIIIFEKLLIKRGYKQKVDFRPLPKPQVEDWKQLLIRCMLVSILVLFFVPMGMKCVVAPPLLVAFTEACDVTEDSFDKEVSAFFTTSRCVNDFTDAFTNRRISVLSIMDLHWCLTFNGTCVTMF